MLSVRHHPLQETRSPSPSTAAGSQYEMKDMREKVTESAGTRIEPKEDIRMSTEEGTPVVLASPKKTKLTRVAEFFAPKFLCFTQLGSGFFLPLLTAYFTSHGYGPETLGFLMAILPFVGALVGPVWSGIGDKTGKPELLLLICNVLNTIGYCSLYWGVNNVYALFTLLIISAALRGGIPPMMESIVVQVSPPGTYGQQRLFGSLGYGVMVILSGAIVSKTGNESMFYMIAATALITIVSIVLIWKLLPTSNVVPTKPETRQPFVKSLVILFKKAEFDLLLIRCFFNAAALSIAASYVFVYLQDRFHTSSADMYAILGYALAVGIGTEVPGFFLHGIISKRTGSEDILMIISHIAGVVRFTCYMFIPSQWFVLLVEVLHGLHFSWLWGPGVVTVARLAPPGLEVTAQAIFGSIGASLGASVGTIVAGYVYKAYGPAVLFGGVAGMMFCLVVLGCISFAVFRRKRTLKRIKLSRSGEESADVETETVAIQPVQKSAKYVIEG